MDIVGSTNLTMHMPFLKPHGWEGTAYAPPSTYAIWTLSKIVSHPPMTYFDPGWEMGLEMTGERKRWVEWWHRNKDTVP
jgi:hypothetical protein